MNNLSVRQKLLLSLAPLLLVLALLALTAIDSLSTLTQRAERLVSINYLLDDLNDIRAAQMAYALSADPAELALLRQAHRRVNELVDENLARMPSSQAQASLPTIRRIMDRYLENLEAGIDQLAGPLGRQLTHDVLTAIEQVNVMISEQNAHSASESRQRSRLMIAMVCVGLLLAGVAAWMLIRQIGQPLQQALQMARRIGEGDLDACDLPARRDEFGQLLQALARSAANLRGILQQVDQVSARLSAAAGTLAGIIERTGGGPVVMNPPMASTAEQPYAVMLPIQCNAEPVTKRAQGSARQVELASAKLEGLGHELKKLISSFRL